MAVRTNRPALRGALLLQGAGRDWTEACMQTVEPALKKADDWSFELTPCEGSNLDVASVLLAMAVGSGARKASFYPVSASALESEALKHEENPERYGRGFADYLNGRLPSPPFDEMIRGRFRALMNDFVHRDRPGNPGLVQAIAWPAAQIPIIESLRLAMPRVAEKMYGDHIASTVSTAVTYLFVMSARRDARGFNIAAATLELCVLGWPPIGKFAGGSNSWGLLTR